MDRNNGTKPSIRRVGRIWVLLALVSIAALSVSATASHLQPDVTSSATGTTDLEIGATLPVTVTLNDADAVPVKVVVNSLNSDIAQLVVDGQTVVWHEFTLTTSKPSATYQVQALCPGRAAIAWYAYSPSRGTGYNVYQVQITSVAPDTCQPGLDASTDTASNITIQPTEAQPWLPTSVDGIDVDHSIGDNSSLTYQVSLTVEAGETCPASAEVGISATPIQRYSTNYSTNTKIGIAIGAGVPEPRVPLGDGTVTLTFAACDVPQSVTVYGIPDVDYYYSVLTLDHDLTQRNGEAQNPPVVGPKLTLWASDIMFFRVGASSPWDPERLHPERRFNRVRHYLKDQLYTDARYPASEASSDSVPWTQFCLKIYDRGHPTARINTALPLASVTLFPRVTARFYQGKATEYGYRTYSGTAVVIPPLEFQVYSEVVSDGELCQPAPASGGSGEWETFFDGSEHDRNYRIGEVSIPHEHFNKWVNVRIRGVFGGERDGEGQVTVADPFRMGYTLRFGLQEYHQKVFGWLSVKMLR